MITENIDELMHVIAAQTTSEPNTAEIQRLEKKIMQGTAVMLQIEKLHQALEGLGLPKKECRALIYPIVERLTSLVKKEVTH